MIYLLEGLMSIGKLFANDTSLFSGEHDPKTKPLPLNKDLLKINQWT